VRRLDDEDGCHGNKPHRDQYDQLHAHSGRFLGYQTSSSSSISVAGCVTERSSALSVVLLFKGAEMMPAASATRMATFDAEPAFVAEAPRRGELG
jgi:hypothetical protein